MQAIRTATTTTTLQHNLKVYTRFRPLNRRQLSTNYIPIHRKLSCTSLALRSPNQKWLNFQYDGVFDVDSTQQQIYQQTASPILSSVLQGCNGTIMAYGQTASGKTHTMYGPPVGNPLQKGIIPRTISHLFQYIDRHPEQFTVKVSVVELYLQKIRDMIDCSKQDLKVRSTSKKGTYIENVTEEYVGSKEEMEGLVEMAEMNRVAYATRENQRSSRSHLVMIVTVGRGGGRRRGGSSGGSLGEGGSSSSGSSKSSEVTTIGQKIGKLFLVDLAGSQKVGRSGTQGRSFQQSNKINTSLTCLGKVITSLSEPRPHHIPYRQSKLTRILQESLGGNSQTTLVVTCSPHISNLSETISSLRFGVCARKVKNRTVLNRQLTVSELQAMLERAQCEAGEKRRRIGELERCLRGGVGGGIGGIGGIEGDQSQEGFELSKMSIPQLNLQSSPETTTYKEESESDQYIVSRLDFLDSDMGSETLTGRSGCKSLMDYHHQTLSRNTSTQQHHPVSKLRQPLKITCSNIAECDYQRAPSKPLTQRTPRWSQIQTQNQNHHSTDIKPICVAQDLAKMKKFSWASKEPKQPKEPWSALKIPTSSLESSFQEENPEGEGCLPTSRQGNRESITEFQPETTNNTILEVEENQPETTAVLSWNQMCELFGKKLAKNREQTRQVGLKLQHIHEQRLQLNNKIRKPQTYNDCKY